jgi:hypothetical protein
MTHELIHVAAPWHILKQHKPHLLDRVMYMHSYKLTDGTILHAFKDINTRGYDYYDDDGNEWVQRTNLMSQKLYWERADTPRCWSPASETYWSM